MSTQVALRVGRLPDAQIIDALRVPTPEPATPPAVIVRKLGWSAAGIALFGIALRTAAEQASPDLGHLVWSAALPMSLLLSWAVCVPALYILWAARQQGIGLAHCVQAMAEAVSTTGACLASTAPLLWFFAVTAPMSRVVPPLGFLFTALALVAAGVEFGKSLRRSGAQLSGRAQAGFLALVLLTFLQFASSAHLHWF